MYAVTISESGGPDVLRWSQVPDPTPGPGEVLIEVHASAVNRADLLQRAGQYPPPPGAPPYPGLECAGVVAAGFGPGTDWYCNLRAHPEAIIQIATRRIRVRAEPLTPEQGSKVMVRYARRHTRAARTPSRLMGFVADGTAEDYAAVGRETPFLHLEPPG